MALSDKEFLKLLNTKKKVIIDLGCGPNKLKDSIGIDIIDMDKVDYVTNLEDGLPFIPNKSVDEFHTSHFLEHVSNFEKLMREMFRTLKPGGRIIIKVPHFSNPYYYSDYTHKRFFGLYSFDYFTLENTGYKRTVPNYNDINFIIEDRKLYFKSPHFFFINAIKKYFFNWFFNINKYMQSLYEDSCSKIIACYELHFTLSKPSSNE